MITQKSRLRRLTLPNFKHSLIFLATMTLMNSALANPQGGAVTTGNATITASGKSTVIQQSSQQAIINWQSFNIAAGEKTQFVQPNASAIALNRINPMQGASQINGQLTSNGQIVLINAAGLHFGSGAAVNVGGLIASTSDISDANFLAGKYVFDQPSTYRNATITNQGSIKAANFGLVALLGNTVINNGLIQAEMGSVVLGSGTKFTLDFKGDQLINFTVDAPATSGGSISNTGSLIADAGKVLVTAEAASNVLNNVIDMGGTTQANSVSQQNGEIILSSNANINVSGKLQATGSASSGNSGGTIQISAGSLTATPQALLNVSGDTGGGNINLTANTISFLGGSVQANTFTSGNGGTINFNSTTTSFANSLVSAVGLGTGTSGGTINIASNNINITSGTRLNTNGDFIGGNVTLSGGNQTNANLINLDNWSEVSANATGSDSVVGGNINLYANNAFLGGTISANDSSGSFGVGGDIGVFGQNLYVLPGAYINASADFVGGVVTLGGNPFATTASTTSANVIVSSFSDISAAVTGNNGFGGDILVSGDAVQIAGELDVSGNPFPYVTYSSSGSSGSGLYGLCGGSGGFHLTPTLNNSGSSGGDIEVSGNNIAVLPGAYLNAAGNFIGGEIQLGNSQFSATPSNSVTVSFGALLDAGAYGTTGNPIGGLVELYANNTTFNGSINVSGVANSGALAGEVEIFANNTVNVGSLATIFANGDTDGGEVLIGGDLNGAGTDPNAQKTNVAALSYISASALTNGDGGEVVVYSTNTTNFGGIIFARGGATSGNGGEVEISGVQTLNFTNTAYVDVTAPHGMTGTLLLDPANLTIGNNGVSSGGTSFLSVAELEKELQMANVVLSTDASGATGDINVNNTISWGSKNSLTLNAYRNININATVSNSKGGSLTLNADSTLDGTGTVNFGAAGSIKITGGGTVSQ